MLSQKATANFPPVSHRRGWNREFVNTGYPIYYTYLTWGIHMFISGQDSDISGNLLSLETQVADNPDLIYGWSDMLEDCVALKSNFVTCSIILFTKGNSQCISLLTWTGSSDSKILRLPKFLDNQHLKAIKLSVLPTGRVSPLEYPQCSFLLDAESIPGP